MEKLIKNGSEIERRFLLNRLPNDLNNFKHSYIDQYYLNDKATRIRSIDDHYILTQKSGAGLSRTEIEYEISKDHFDSLKASAITHIMKTRYYIPLGGLTADLDIFDGPYKGIVICEVEFNSIEEAIRFEKPSWFGPDITYEKKLSNKDMSKNPTKALEYFNKVVKKYYNLED